MTLIRFRSVMLVLAIVAKPPSDRFVSRWTWSGALIIAALCGSIAFSKADDKGSIHWSIILAAYTTLFVVALFARKLDSGLRLGRSGFNRHDRRINTYSENGNSER